MTQASKNNKTPVRRPARKGRRRIHKGRVAMVLTVLALIIISVMTVLSRCSDDAGDVFRKGGNFRAPIPLAVEAGRSDAMKVVSTTPGSMERDNALLFIKAREHRLRKAGYGHAADDYINAAGRLLVEHGVITPKNK